MMAEEGWDEGQDSEELFEFAMHERQYRDYKSGVAAERFRQDLESRRAAAGAPIVVKRPVVEMPEFDLDALLAKYPDAKPLQAPVKGQMLWQIDVEDRCAAPVAGTEVAEGEAAGYVQAYYGMEPVVAPTSGRIVAVTAPQGKKVGKGEIVALYQ